MVKKAALLADMHLRSLRQKMTLLQLTEESAKKLEVIFRVVRQLRVNTSMFHALWSNCRSNLTAVIIVIISRDVQSLFFVRRLRLQLRG